jgi:DinB superfamily
MKTKTMERTTNDLYTQSRQTCGALLETLEKFTPEDFNRTPPCGGWTAGQIAQHLILSGGVTEAISGKTEPVTRPADQYVDGISAIFLDFTIKLQSPDFIIPEIRDYDHQEMISRLKIIWSKLKEAMRLLDLTALCVDFEFPTIGHLTRLEWIWFYIFHTQRHVLQLSKLLPTENMTLNEITTPKS